MSVLLSSCARLFLASIQIYFVETFLRNRLNKPFNFETKNGFLLQQNNFSA